MSEPLRVTPTLKATKAVIFDALLATQSQLNDAEEQIENLKTTLDAQLTLLMEKAEIIDGLDKLKLEKFRLEKDIELRKSLLLQANNLLLRADSVQHEQRAALSELRTQLEEILNIITGRFLLGPLKVATIKKIVGIK